MDDVIVSIAISITELYGQLSGKRVVLCITKAVKCSSLVFGNNICSPTRYAVHDTGASIANTACYGFFTTQRGWLHTVVTKTMT